MIVLIFGQSDSGKTELGKRLNSYLNFYRLNEDDIRKSYDDWDYSEEGVIRLSERLVRHTELLSATDYLIDCIDPVREIIEADYSIYVGEPLIADVNWVVDDLECYVAEILQDIEQHIELLRQLKELECE